MPSHGNRTGRDTLDAVLQRINDLEAEVHELQGGHRVSMDRGDANSLTVDKGAFEGQTLIQYADSAPYTAETAYYFSNGEWRPFTSGFDPNPDYCHYQSSGSTTVAAGSGGLSDWSIVAGNGSLVDLSTPTAPEILTRGVYSIAVTYSSTSVLWTVGATFQGVLTLNGTHQQQMWSTVTIGTDQAPRQGFVSAVQQLDVGDSFQIQLNNDDSVSRDMTMDEAWIQRIIAY